jgi:hypothetical protein
MSDYPEHEKFKKIQDETQVVGEFLDWAADEEGVHLMSTNDGGSRPYRVDWMPLLARWAGIDLEKLEDEKRAMLDELRKGQT